MFEKQIYEMFINDVHNHFYLEIYFFGSDTSENHGYDEHWFQDSLEDYFRPRFHNHDLDQIQNQLMEDNHVIELPTTLYHF